MKKLLSLLIALAMLLCAVPGMAEESTSKLTKDVVILFTSDVHCGIDQGFGYAGLYAVKEQLAKTNNVLLVDDGDAIQGEPVGTVTHGSAIIDLMNTVGYDVAIPGNHEYDYGMENFMNLTKQAKFPYISCNFTKNGELVFPAYVIKEVEGVKIGFIGITTPETLTKDTPKNFQDDKGNFIYSFMEDGTGEKLYAAVQTAADDARKAGADYVIAIAHLGNEASSSPYNYADVLGHTTGIDALVDGHSHDTDQLVMKNKDGKDVIRAACGTKLEGIGYVTISAKDGSLSCGLYTWHNSTSAPALLGIENEVSKAVSAATDGLNAELSKVVAKTAVDLTINDPTAKDANGSPVRIIRNAETNLGDLCADAYRDQTGAQVAIVNGGGIRASISAGDITLNDIMKVHPFGNQILVLEVTGQQLLDALEFASRDVPNECGSFLQVSGMSYEIHTYIKSSCTMDDKGVFTGVSGEYRVKNVKIGDEALDLTKTYTLAGHDHTLLNGGGGMSMFNGCKVVKKNVKLDNQVLIDYIVDTLGGVVGEAYANPYGQGRIVAVPTAPAK
ncbi:MAG: bifunctional UDP-sugar hydrolase/5'-nucleotidase [Clostridia bacterium]|nr:bifunctional UDP-sugar hydrolase/5'-nucleotidase [Clostridia bacterium]